jgi:serine/threonine-protein kinase
VKASLSQIGRYRIDEKVGSGGMACVYRGALEGARGFERQVAIKVLHPHLSDDDDYLQMFHEEAQIASRLEHPVLVPVTDLGDVDGLHYMVMDYLEGENLSELHTRYKELDRPFPVGNALWIMAQVLDGLHYAHELEDASGAALGIVHRDVSPRNIVVSRSGAVKLVDFGVARQANRGMTQAGVVKGTVPYMPPEQARGDVPDRRADIFAAAVVLHELITGEPPLKDEDTELQRQALARGKVAINLKKIHLALRPVMQKALAIDRENRFDTAAEFADAMREVLPVLEPGFEATKLVGITGLRKERERRSGARRRRKKESRFRTNSSAGPAAGKRGAQAALTSAATAYELAWDGPKTVGLFALMIFLSAMIYAFVSST